MKKTIYLLCAACLTWGCTDDLTNDPCNGATSPPGELVPVSLVLRMGGYTAPTAQPARSMRASGTSSDGVVSVEISALSTPSATRAGGEPTPLASVPDDDIVYRLDVLQFNGTGNNAQLILKQTFNSLDGDVGQIGLESLQLVTSGTVTNRIVVVCNADPVLFYNQLTSATKKDDGTYEGGSTYGNFQNMAISRRTDVIDDPYPRVTRSPGNGLNINIPIICGITTTTIVSGSQIGIELLRNIAKTDFQFYLSPNIRQKYNNWEIVLNNISTASYYNSQGRSVPFPGEPSYYTTQLYSDTPTENITTIIVPNIYLPVNLQPSAPGTTVATRYLNTPANATTLQLLGKKIVDGNITQTVVFQIPLGSNFTDDYSIRGNTAIRYGITLADDNPDDSSVVKFIPGKFAGKLTGYDTANNPIAFTPGQNPQVYKEQGIVRFGYPDELEVWPTDVTYKRYGDLIPHPTPGLPMMIWGWMQADSYPADLGDNWLWDGRANTQKVCGATASWHYPYAAYSCYRQLNGISDPYNSVEAAPHMWFLPAINQLVGVYAAAGSQISAMQSSYWSSSMKKENNKEWAYRLRQDGTMELLNIRDGTDGLLPTAAVRACRIPPPGR